MVWRPEIPTKTAKDYNCDSDLKICHNSLEVKAVPISTLESELFVVQNIPRVNEECE